MESDRDFEQNGTRRRPSRSSEPGTPAHPQAREAPWLRPRKLHSKIAVAIAMAAVSAFGIVTLGLVRTALAIEREQVEERALLQARTLADDIADEQELSDDAAAVRGEQLKRYSLYEVSLIQIYRFAPGDAGATTVAALPRDQARALAAGEIARLVAGDHVASTDRRSDGHLSVWAAAPVVVRDANGSPSRRSVAGAVAVRIEVPSSDSLVARLGLLALGGAALMVGAVVAVTYLLFRRLVYRPIGALVGAMAQLKAGELDVYVTPESDDEIGEFTADFNETTARLRELDGERATHERDLEECVRAATAELAASNEHLRRRNVELYETQRHAGQLERLAATGQLAAQFAHEVGTPLNLISGHVQLLEPAATSDRMRRRLAMISEQITRIERIVRAMLDQTRRPVASYEPVDLDVFLSHLLDTFSPTLVARGVEAELSVDASLPSVVADSDQLQQVFINLTNNSLDAMRGGGRLRVEVRRDGANARVTFADTGAGIAPVDLARVFEPLFTTKERGQGNGLGLAVSRQIVEEHGGTIAVTSRVGEGTTFTITLPLSLEGRRTSAASAAESEESSS